MSSIKFKRGQNANLNNVPIEDGSILLVEDTAQLFFDTAIERKEIGSPTTVKYTEQVLTNEQKVQARDNIGAIDIQTVDTKIAALVDSAPDDLKTLNELANALGDDPNFATTVATEIGKKVDKVEGKGLSTNDFTNEEKSKLDAMPSPFIVATIGYVGEMTENKVDKVDGKGLSTNDFTDGYKKKLDNEMVGKITEAAGAEIFNDYKNNQAVSRNSHAEGVNTKAGTRAFKIIALDGTIGGIGIYTLDSGEGVQVGMTYSAVTSFAAYNNGKITAVNGNVITVNNYPGHPLNTATDDPSNFNMYNLFIIVDHPELGTVDAGFNAHTEGNNTFAAQVDTHAEGRNTRALGEYAHTEGIDTQAGHISHAEGNGSQALGDHSHAEGYQTKAIGSCSHAEGVKTAIRDVTDQVVLSKFRVPESHRSDIWNKGTGAHVEGQETVASSNAAHAEGNTTYAIGSCSHSEGHLTLAAGHQAHAEGSETEATGNSSHAEGHKTIAEGASSHSEGSVTQALKDYSHAQGQKTIASGKHSHAEGYWTIASGEQSHAGGNQTSAEGVGAFAHGYNTHARNAQSSTFGSNTVANYSQQFVVGYYNNNKEDNLFEVGNGSSSNKSNAFEVTKSGIAKADGKTLATEQYVDEKVANVVTSSDSTPIEIIASATQPTPVAGKTIIWIDTSALS